MSRNGTRGFTLVEAAVAIGVVAILAGIIVPLVLHNIRDAKNARARNDMQIIAAAIASQLKDTGCRPRAAGGPGGCSGVSAPGEAPYIWHSAGQAPLMVGPNPGVPAPAAPPARLILRPLQTFENLFMAPNNVTGTTRAQGNALFGVGAPGPRSEFGYKGPYMGDEIAHKTDPWGRAYLILGYNAQGHRTDGPIWIVSAGESGRILRANVTNAGGQAVSTWATNPATASNLAIRVH